MFWRVVPLEVGDEPGIMIPRGRGENADEHFDRGREDGDHRGDVNYADFDGQMIEVSIEIASTPATTPSATPI